MLASLLEPDLKIGVTLANFQTSGKIPFHKEELKISVNGLEMRSTFTKSQLCSPVTNCFIRIRYVIFSEEQFHNFEKKPTTHYFHVTEDKAITLRNSIDTIEENNEAREVAEENRIQVGVTYEEAFLNDVRSLTGKRTRNRPIRLIEEDNESCNVAELLTTEISEPRTISEAWNGEHSIHWQEATDGEYSSLISNNTWELVPLPKSKKTVGC